MPPLRHGDGFLPHAAEPLELPWRNWLIIFSLVARKHELRIERFDGFVREAQRSKARVGERSVVLDLKSSPPANPIKLLINTGFIFRPWTRAKRTRSVPGAAR